VVKNISRYCPFKASPIRTIFLTINLTFLPPYLHTYYSIILKTALIASSSRCILYRCFIPAAAGNGCGQKWEGGGEGVVNHATGQLGGEGE
jgi:hypothetical protein